MNKNNLIPRKILFGNPEKTGVKVSPDSKYISYLAPHNGVLNVFVAPIKDLSKARLVTNDTGRGIRMYFWSYKQDHLLYFQDKNGDENFQLHLVDVESCISKNLTDFNDTRAEIEAIHYSNPSKIIIGMNKRRKDYFDIYSLDLDNGSIEEIYQNNEFSSITVDDNYALRFASKLDADSNVIIQKFDEDMNLHDFIKIPSEDRMTTSIAAFTRDLNEIYMLDSRDRDTAALFKVNVETMHKELLYSHPTSDLSGITIHPIERNLQAVSYEYTRKEKVFIDHKFKEHYEYVRNNIKNHKEISVISRTLDDTIWIIADLRDEGPVSYYKYDTISKEISFLFKNRNDLDPYILNEMHSIVIKSRDGMNLVSYLTVPSEVNIDRKTFQSDKSVPLVLWVHGGPHARDSWGYDAVHQWLSNRGYAVLSVNYRSSTGFGKRFINAGDGQWSKKNHEDLIDTVNWAIERGITKKDTVAIGGGSYGGYAALVGLTFTPDVFACAIDIVGPSNLETLLNSIPEYWKPALASLEKSLGGHLRDDIGKAALAERSPITYVDQISKPLLIGHGANDPRVKQAESDQITSLMQAKNIPVTYVLYPKEGHGFAKPENKISFFAMMEAFLSKVFKNQPFEKTDDDFKGADFQIKAGADFIDIRS